MGLGSAAMEHLPAGQELLRIHRQLRARLVAITATLERGIPEPESFATSCLAFCRALRRHHLGEDDAAFGVVRRHAPELEDALAELVRDHEFLDPMLDRLEVLSGDPARAPADPALQREVDGIAAVLENHLAYEERVLVDVLDRLPVAAGSEDDQALRAPFQGLFSDE